MELEMEEDAECVPRKYYEYLNSLNDMQREAACSDVAVPLMIVAGPGSGKVSICLIMVNFIYIYSMCLEYRVLSLNIMDRCNRVNSYHKLFTPTCKMSTETNYFSCSGPLRPTLCMV